MRVNARFETERITRKGVIIATRYLEIWNFRQKMLENYSHSFSFGAQLTRLGSIVDCLKMKPAQVNISKITTQ